VLGVIKRSALLRRRKSASSPFQKYRVLDARARSVKNAATAIVPVRLGGGQTRRSCRLL